VQLYLYSTHTPSWRGQGQYYLYTSLRILFSKEKRPKPGTDHWLHSSAKIKNGWNWTSTSLRLYGVHKYNCTCTLNYELGRIWQEDLKGIDWYAAFAVTVLRFVTWFTLESGERAHKNDICIAQWTVTSLLQSHPQPKLQHWLVSVHSSLSLHESTRGSASTVPHNS